MSNLYSLERNSAQDKYKENKESKGAGEREERKVEREGKRRGRGRRRGGKRDRIEGRREDKSKEGRRGEGKEKIGGNNFSEAQQQSVNNYPVGGGDDKGGQMPTAGNNGHPSRKSQ